MIGVALLAFVAGVTLRDVARGLGEREPNGHEAGCVPSSILTIAAGPRDSSSVPLAEPELVRVADFFGWTQDDIASTLEEIAAL